MKFTRQGVRDLSQWSAKDDRPPPVNYVGRHHQLEVAQQSNKAVDVAYTDEERRDDEIDRIFTDLIYAAAIEQDVKAVFPEARFEDASDIVHDERTEVKLCTSKRKWFKFLIESGMAGISLHFQLESRMKPAIIYSILDELKPGWRAR